MTGISLFWRWMVLCWMLGLPCAIYGEKLEDLFEEEVDEKVESDTTFFITPKEVKRNFREYHRKSLSTFRNHLFLISSGDKISWLQAQSFSNTRIFPFLSQRCSFWQVCPLPYAPTLIEAILPNKNKTYSNCVENTALH